VRKRYLSDRAVDVPALSGDTISEFYSKFDGKNTVVHAKKIARKMKNARHQKFGAMNPEYTLLYPEENGSLIMNTNEHVAFMSPDPIATPFEPVNLIDNHTRLTPAMSVTTFTNANEEEREAIERMLQLQYAGSNNAGSLLYMDVDSPENKPDITPIPQNGADDYYYNLNEMVMQKILTAHRITSPMILGIKTPGQLGGRDETIDAYLLLLNTVIRPYQQDILAVFEELMEEKYPEQDVTLGVQQLKLFDDGTEEVDVVTSIDATVGDDSALEAEIEKADRENATPTEEELPITELPLA